MFAHPKTRIAPTQVAPDTFVIHDHHGEGHAPVSVALNTMVIRAAEPVVVDTGVVENRDQYLADVFSIVEPEDIRWVFISHDDIDHTGNLNALMELAPNATAIVNWFMVDRMGATLAVPPTRQRWIGDGESFEVGDRTLHAVRPPVFDSPTTRGLYDSKTGVYWSSDSFAAPMLTPAATVSDFDPDFWHEGQHTFDRYVSPWLELVDDRRFQAQVDRVQALAPTAMVGCHTPAILGRDRVDAAIAATRLSPTAEIQPQPDQAVLDQIQLAIEGIAA
jgi:flavorubredoxin